ncbi:MAG: hypothetical protein QOJ91_377 [Sphingomonadales bacterium]|jgi:hypothetical protein|nr:hypothetical protein [Sphingomonadales bacterium]
MRRPIILFGLALSACGQPAPVANRSADVEAAPEAPVVTPESQPVRIGDYGANFRACGAAGTPRNLKAGEALPVRFAPFENAGLTGSVAARAQFFVCTRSFDQKWFGIVYDEGGTLAERCGVSEPVSGPRAYAGPCRSGWVESAFVKVIAGEEPAPAARPDAENVSEPAKSAIPGG